MTVVSLSTTEMSEITRLKIRSSGSLYLKGHSMNFESVSQQFEFCLDKVSIYKVFFSGQDISSAEIVDPGSDCTFYVV